jgi:predicted nicotinamide N-methyase
MPRLERCLQEELVRLRAKNQHLLELNGPKARLAVGTRVSAKWHNESGYPGWHCAKIEAINDDGTFHIIYEDGGHWLDVPPSKINSDGGAAGTRPESNLTDEQKAAIDRVYASLRAAQVDNAYTLTSSAGITYSVTVLEEMMVDVGTRVWDAALYLAQWCLDHPAAFEGSRCVELGAGCAATGLFAAHVCREMLLTDYTEELKKYIVDNITLNIGESAAVVTAGRLDWTETEVFINMEPCDVALGADIVYIPELMADLIAATYNCLRPGGFFYGVSPGKPTVQLHTHHQCSCTHTNSAVAHTNNALTHTPTVHLHPHQQCSCTHTNSAVIPTPTMHLHPHQQALTPTPTVQLIPTLRLLHYLRPPVLPVLLSNTPTHSLFESTRTLSSCLFKVIASGSNLRVPASAWVWQSSCGAQSVRGYR